MQDFSIKWGCRGLSKKLNFHKKQIALIIVSDYRQKVIKTICI